jgi:peptidoglycan/LPS O-acetylase OafA/YrhL
MYKSIQACRGLAAFQVLLYHTGTIIALPKYFGLPEFKRAFCFGDSGVEFFFVLSGFIITWVHRDDFGKPAALPAYISKRLIRIYPTYWVVFLSVFLLAWVSPALRAGLPNTSGVLLRSLLLVPQDPAVIGGTGAPVLIVAWTLQYEMVFYIIAGTSMLHRAVLGVVVLLLLGNYAVCLQGCSFPASFLSSNLLFLFVFGATVAWLSDGRIIFKRPVVLSLVALFAYFVLVAVDVLTETRDYSIDRPIAYGLVFSVLILSVLQAENSGVIFGGSKPFQVLGDASYALYLIHFPLLSVLCKIAMAARLHGYAGATVAFAVMVPAAVAVAVIFNQWLERPMLRKLSALVPRRAVAPAVA